MYLRSCPSRLGVDERVIPDNLRHQRKVSLAKVTRVPLVAECGVHGENEVGSPSIEFDLALLVGLKPFGDVRPVPKPGLVVGVFGDASRG